MAATLIRTANQKPATGCQRCSSPGWSGGGKNAAVSDSRYERIDGPAGMAPEAVPAATVVPLRSGTEGMEVLMVRRRRGGAFSGLWVFPGGRVEASDVAQPLSLPSDRVGERAAEVAVARRCALREATEEAGLVLEASSTVVHSWWLPPPETPRRFSTWFFLAATDEGSEVVVDREEVHEHRWSTPAALLAARDAGEIGLAPPTWVTLWQLRAFDDPTGALSEAAARPPREFVTHLLTGADGRQAAVWEGDAGYRDADLGRPGPRRRLWVGADSAWEAELSADAGVLR